MFGRSSLTVYPAYFGDPLTGERSSYVYCSDVEGLVTTEQLKGYNVYHKSDFYFDIIQDRLVDFNAVIEGLESEAATLKWIAEEKLTWFKEESEQKRRDFRSVRPSGSYRADPPKPVTKVKSLTGKIADLLKRKK